MLDILKIMKKLDLIFVDGNLRRGNLNITKKLDPKYYSIYLHFRGLTL